MNQFEYCCSDTSLAAPMIEATKKSNYRASSFRWAVLILSCLNGVGNYFCFDNPQALQAAIVDDFKINTFWYNLLYSVYAFPNIILPFFGGMFVDKFGVRLGINLFSFLLIIGQGVVTFGAYSHNYNLMLAGRVIYGFGGESLGVAQSVLISKWFKGKELALALGATLCFSRLGSSFNSFFSPMVYGWFHEVYAPFLVGAFFCVFSFISGLFANYFDNKADEMDVTESRNNDNPLSTASIKDFKSFTLIYYLLLLNGFFLYGGFYGLNTNINDLMVQRFGFNSEQAGQLIPIIYLCAAVIIPLFGMYTDYKGKRAFFMLISSAIFVADHLILAYLPSSPKGVPNYSIVGILFGVGLFYSTYAAIYWPCIPLVVKERLVGTAYGIATALQNLMLTIIPMVLGVIHDHTNTAKQKFGYYWTEITLAGLVVLGFFTTLAIYIEDMRTGERLNKPATEEIKEKLIPYSHPSLKRF